MELTGGWYCAINREDQRRAVFRDPADCKNFLEQLAEFPNRFGVPAHTSVLMPDHYDLLLEPGSQPALGARHWLNPGYGIWFNRRQGVGSKAQVTTRKQGGKREIYHTRPAETLLLNIG